MGIAWLTGAFMLVTVAECLRMAHLRHEAPSMIHSGKAIALPAAAVEILRLTGITGRTKAERTIHLQ